MNSYPKTDIYPLAARVLATQCALSQPFSSQLEDASAKPEMYNFDAIWDTGSECTTISRKTAQFLGLAPISEVEAHHSGGRSMSMMYLLNLRLANGVEFEGLRVMDGNFDDTDVLIGMDVLSQCDFTITHPNNATKVSYQIPSVADIDFTSRK